jgi:hypothetical protein
MSKVDRVTNYSFIFGKTFHEDNELLASSFLCTKEKQKCGYFQLHNRKLEAGINQRHKSMVIVNQFRVNARKQIKWRVIVRILFARCRSELLMRATLNLERRNDLNSI